MWHCLTHATTEENLLKILESKVIKADWGEEFPINPHAFCFYLSSAIKMHKNRNWNFSEHTREDPVIIGISPQILNKQNFIMCDKHAGAQCAIVEEYTVINNKNDVDFNIINNFINKRLHPIASDLGFMIKHYKYKILDRLYQSLNSKFNYINVTLPDNNQTREILDKIEEVNHMSNDEIIDEYNRLNLNRTKYSVNSYTDIHEFVIQDGIHVNYIDFILISKAANQKFKYKLRKMCPSWIKIKEIEPADFTRWTEKTEKILSELAEKI
jgi:hypothetical protein